MEKNEKVCPLKHPRGGRGRKTGNERKTKESYEGIKNTCVTQKEKKIANLVKTILQCP